MALAADIKKRRIKSNKRSKDEHDDGERLGTGKEKTHKNMRERQLNVVKA